MKTLNFARAARAALIAAAIGNLNSAALADIRDYKFELVDQTVQEGPDKVIAVRLINTKTGKPVPDAVIFATTPGHGSGCNAGDGYQSRTGTGR